MLNTDSSFSITGAGYGFVLQNHEANVLKSGAGPLSNITSEQHAEIMSLIVVTDRQHAQFKEKDTNLSVLGGIFDNLKILVQQPHCYF